MTFTRRRFLATGATAGLGAVAGCVGSLEDALAAAPARVAETALSETGYAERTIEEVVIERTVGRFGLERTIEVSNWYAEYDRAVALDAVGLSRVQAAVVSVLTTPQVSVLGRTFNPVGEYSTDELVELIQGRYDRIEDVDRVDEETVSILGSETTVARYLARARLADAGATLDVYLQVGEPVAHGEDFVIPVAVYPQALGLEAESPSVRTLLENVEHE